MATQVTSKKKGGHDVLISFIVLYLKNTTSIKSIYFKISMCSFVLIRFGRCVLCCASCAPFKSIC